jgi:aminoglycoside phosphotransferase (APT) family kinase protein
MSCMNGTSKRKGQSDDKPDEAILDFLARALPWSVVNAPRMTRLTGGVASDIWLVEGVQTFCVKRALKKLKVAAEWFVPVQRNANEAAWLRVAREILPSAAPRVLAEDVTAGVFAMEYCPPSNFYNWKSRLMLGLADPLVASRVGSTIARIHAGTAAQPSLGERFDNDDIFLAIRLEPYLTATGRAHPDLAAAFDALVTRTLANKKALVHGDVSPKNIMVGPEGPMFLDAECAWWGDPAFDIAFCLNHMLLKCLVHPGRATAYLECFDQLTASYLRGVAWEDAAGLEARAASLLPALFLARVDGNSPVEYVTTERDKETVRRVAKPLFADQPQRLAAVANAWAEELKKRQAS